MGTLPLVTKGYHIISQSFRHLSGMPKGSTKLSGFWSPLSVEQQALFISENGRHMQKRRTVESMQMGGTTPSHRRAAHDVQHVRAYMTGMNAFKSVKQFGKQQSHAGVHDPQCVRRRARKCQWFEGEKAGFASGSPDRHAGLHTAERLGGSARTNSGCFKKWRQQGSQAEARTFT